MNRQFLFRAVGVAIFSCLGFAASAQAIVPSHVGLEASVVNVPFADQEQVEAASALVQFRVRSRRRTSPHRSGRNRDRGLGRLQGRRRGTRMSPFLPGPVVDEIVRRSKKKHRACELWPSGC